MNHILSLFITLFSINALSTEMVFLVEGPSGKQVGISQDNQSFSYYTKSKKWSLYPDISANGEWITYVQGDDNTDLQIVVENNKSKIKEIWGNKGFMLQSRFAENGKVLFYSKKMNNGENYIVKINLGLTRRATRPVIRGGVYHYNAKEIVYSNLGKGFFPAPFENGSKIVYQRNGVNKFREIVIHDFNTNKDIIISQGMAPALSKDQNYIAFTNKVNGNWDVFVYDIKTKTIRRVTTHANFDFSPMFDSKNNLFYTSDKLENGVFSIFKQEFTDWSKGTFSEKTMITKKGVSFYAPKVSGNISLKLDIKADMIGKSRSSFGSIYHQGRIYVAGGHQGAEHTYPPESFTGRMTYFDIKQSKWFDVAPRLNPCHGFQLAAKGNYLYAFGGFAYGAKYLPKWKTLSVVERYNIKTNTWKEIGHMPRKRSSNIVSQIGSKVYLIGGWDSTPKFVGDKNGTFHDEIDIFDITTNSFSTLKTKLPMKRRAFSGFVKDEKIYFVGGISEGADHFTLMKEFMLFDPVSEEFKKLKDLPFATFAPAAESLGEKAYVFGGMFKMGTRSYEYVRHIYEYDFKANSWAHTGRYLNESKGFSQVVKWKGILGILGGHSYDGASDEPVKTFETFTK